MVLPVHELYLSSLIKRLVTLVLSCFICVIAIAQSCPPNIGFEEGNFNHWECFQGNVDASGTINLHPSLPIFNVHTIIPHDASAGNDFYGDFPIICPNGSGYSVKLGNQLGGAQAERISYTFTVPPNINDYSMIFNYAVVIQNPEHLSHQQPKFTAKVFDVASGDYIQCASFEFIAASNLPGFKKSTKGVDVFYKEWSAVTVKLFGYANKTLRLEFTNNDCTLGGHFGYVYVDVNNNCTSPVTGNHICIGDTSVVLQAPYGFSNYNWFDENFTTLLSSTNTLILSPPPANYTRYALEVIPFIGVGCRDTLYTIVQTVNDTFDLQVLDSVRACKVAGYNLTNNLVTAGSSSNLSISYHTDPYGLAFLPTPQTITNSGTYYIKGTSTNGCKVVAPIHVNLLDDPNLIINPPLPVTYPSTVNLTLPDVIAGSDPNINVTYWKDGAASQSLPNPSSIAASGTYFIKAVSAYGCTTVKPVKVTVGPPNQYEILAPNVFSPNGDGINDRFVFTYKGQLHLERISIYNRYGQLVHQSNYTTNYWDGKHNGAPVPVGTYYWIIEGTELYWDRKMKASGSITVVR